MRRMVVMVFLVLSSALAAGSAAAADCELCLESLALQTRDGQPWSTGQPVTLVVRIANHAAPLPSSAQAVVMQTDGDRTKCLGVPLKLVEGDTAGGLYAGLFFPFRPARYDGKLVVGNDVQDITFDMDQMVAGPAPAGELPAAAPIDTSAPVPLLLSRSHLPWVGVAALVFCSLVALARYARQHWLRQPV